LNTVFYYIVLCYINVEFWDQSILYGSMSKCRSTTTQFTRTFYDFIFSDSVPTHAYTSSGRRTIIFILRLFITILNRYKTTSISRKLLNSNNEITKVFKFKQTPYVLQKTKSQKISYLQIRFKLVRYLISFRFYLTRLLLL